MTDLASEVGLTFSPAGPADSRTEDPETAIRFPLTLPISLSAPKLTLVGLGVRKVSFLRVKVYSVGFYLEDSVTKNLTSVEGWHVR